MARQKAGANAALQSLVNERYFRPRGYGSDLRDPFVPAPWLVLLLGIAWTVLTGGKIAKLSLVGLVWSVTPRPLKVAAAGVLLTWILVVAGALAAITLLALHIS
jgi:hypothetical protein